MEDIVEILVKVIIPQERMGRAVDRIADVVTTASRCSASMCLTKSGIFIENSVLMKMAGTTSLALET